MRNWIDLISDIPNINNKCLSWQDIPTRLLEYKLVGDPNFKMPEYDDEAFLLGHIPTRIGNARMMAARDDELMFIWAIVDDVPVGLLALSGKTNPYTMAKNIYVPDQYKGKNIAAEMMLFVLKVMKLVLINDTHRSQMGINLWNKVAKNFDQKIIDLKTKEIYDLPLGNNLMTEDGIEVIYPEEDNKSDHLYNEDACGQRFFYVLADNTEELYEDYIKLASSRKLFLRLHSNFQEGID